MRAVIEQLLFKLFVLYQTVTAILVLLYGVYHYYITTAGTRYPLLLYSGDAN